MLKPPPDLLGDRLSTSGTREERLPVFPLPLGDPPTDSPELAAAAADAGADVLELGALTSGTPPRGTDIARLSKRTLESDVDISLRERDRPDITARPCRNSRTEAMPRAGRPWR